MGGMFLERTVDSSGAVGKFESPYVDFYEVHEGGAGGNWICLMLRRFEGDWLRFH
jgi:hypothetical protein